MTSNDIFKSDLSLIQTVYGVSLVLGYREIATWTYSAGTVFLLDKDIWLLLLKLLISASLVLLGLRFFWATGNIRRYVMNKERRANDRKIVTVVHFPMLLLHAFLFFILSKQASTIVGWEDADRSIKYLACTVVVFLTVNVLWLMLLLRGRQNREPELLLVRNNSVVALFIAADLLLFHFALPSVIVIGPVVAISALFVNSLVDLLLRADSYMA